MSRRLPAPRWQTPLPRTVAGSWGPDVETFARDELGIALDRWQRRAVNRALAVDAGGRLVHRHYLISTGRQNGKTALVRSLIGWALTGHTTPPWARILGLAHDRGQARLIYEPVMQDLGPIRHRLGGRGLAITRYLGIRSDLYGRHREYHVGSKESRNAVRGSSNDLAIFDEVRTQIDYGTWNALEPTTRARPEPLIIGLSTAGDDRSVLLREWWERGRRIIDGAEPFAGFGMTWYAADDDADERRAILQANPAVAEGRLSFDVVAGSRHSLSQSGYRAETLNLWTEGADEWLPPGVWLRQVGPRPERPSRLRVVLGVEAVGTWRRATVTVGIVTDAGAWVGIAGELESSLTGSSSVAPAELVAMLARLASEWGATEVAYSKAAAAGDHVEAWATDAGIRPIPMQGRQVRAASQLFRSELIGGRLTHADDPLLEQQVRSARPSASIEDADWYFSIPESVGEIDALRAAAWASWAAIAPEARDIGPQIFV